MTDVRGLWIYQGQDPPYAKLPAHGITSCWFDPRDPRVTAEYLDGVVAKGYSVGLYFAWDWWTGLSGPQFADKCSAELKRVGWKGNAPVALDIETHDIAGYVVPCLTHWREIRPNRATWYVLEGMQGGLFSAADIVTISGLTIRLAPAMYQGNMEPLPHDVTIDLMMGPNGNDGFAGHMLDGTYNAAALPYRWRGFAFGTLP